MGQGVPVAGLRVQTGAGHWEVYTNNPVLRPGAKGEWDAGALGSMTVLKVGAVCHMYYEAWGVRSSKADNWSEFTSLQIGHATSSDGIHWQKDPANPVLPKGTGADWDRDGTWDPFVLHENGVFKYFCKYVPRNCKGCWTGYATSQDGLHWQVQNPRVLLGHDAEVVKMADNLYFLYYGPDGYYDQKDCDIRMAVFKGTLSSLASPKIDREPPTKP